jgi:hypothetical protein
MAISFLRGVSAYLAFTRQRIVLGSGEPQEIVVPPGPDGRPGERLRAPSRSFHPPLITPDGAREDFRVLLDQKGTTFASVCLRTVVERGGPEESARFTLGRRMPGAGSVDSRLTADTVAGEPAIRYCLEFPSALLTEWKFSHRGWLFVVGVRDRSGDPQATIEATREVLSTWEWLD